MLILAIILQCQKWSMTESESANWNFWMYRHDGPRLRPSTTVFCDNNNNNKQLYTSCNHLPELWSVISTAINNFTEIGGNRYTDRESLRCATLVWRTKCILYCIALLWVLNAIFCHLHEGLDPNFLISNLVGPIVLHNEWGQQEHENIKISIVNVHEEAASVNCIDILLYFTYWSTLSYSTGFILLCIVVSSLFYIYLGRLYAGSEVGSFDIRRVTFSVTPFAG